MRRVCSQTEVLDMWCICNSEGGVGCGESDAHTPRVLLSVLHGQDTNRSHNLPTGGAQEAADKGRICYEPSSRPASEDYALQSVAASGTSLKSFLYISQLCARLP